MGGSPLSPLVYRSFFAYNVPIIPEDVPLTSRSSPLFNFLLACITVLLFFLMRMLSDMTLAIAPASVKLFLRRLPLSLGIFLVLVLLKELLIPTAFAQGGAALPSPTIWVILYSILFFAVAGTTNFVCNNMITSEAKTLEKLFLPRKTSPQESEKKSWKQNLIFLFFFFVAYAIIGAHINTSFSVLPTAQPGIALIAFCTILVAAYCKDGFRFLYARQLRWNSWLEANALGILLALLSVWLTRSLGLSPRYLFGVPAGVVILSQYYAKREGPFEWFGLLTMLAVAGITWLILPFVSEVQVVHDFLKLLIVILLEACFFESLPFAYLSGGSVYRWRRTVWALQSLLTTFLVLQLLWNPSGTLYSLKSSPPGMTYIVLLGVYAAAVLALFLYCKARNAKN